MIKPSLKHYRKKLLWKIPKNCNYNIFTAWHKKVVFVFINNFPVYRWLYWVLCSVLLKVSSALTFWCSKHGSVLPCIISSGGHNYHLSTHCERQHCGVSSRWFQSCLSLRCVWFVVHIFTFSSVVPPLRHSSSEKYLPGRTAGNYWNATAPRKIIFHLYHVHLHSHLPI